MFNYKEGHIDICIKCERGDITFGDKRERKEYINIYCGSLNNWHNCSLASSASRFYERIDENDKA